MASELFLSKFNIIIFPEIKLAHFYYLKIEKIRVLNSSISVEQLSVINLQSLFKKMIIYF